MKLYFIKLNNIMVNFFICHFNKYWIRIKRLSFPVPALRLSNSLAEEAVAVLEPLQDALVVRAGQLGALVRVHSLVPAERDLEDPGEAALAGGVKVEDGVRPGRLSLRVGVPGRFRKPVNNLTLQKILFASIVSYSADLLVTQQCKFVTEKLHEYRIEAPSGH